MTSEGFNAAGDAAPDPRDRVRRFVDSLPWCVDFDNALTQLVKLAVGELGLGSLRIYVREQEGNCFSLRKSSSDGPAEALDADAALILFFETSGSSSVTVLPRSGDGMDAEAGDAPRAQLKSLGADAAFALRAQGKLMALALAAPGSAATIQALEWVVSEFERVAPELLQAEQAALLGRMSNGVAHDLKSCFVSLSTMLQLCGEEEPRLDRVKELLPAALRNLAAAQKIILQAQSAGRSDVFTERPVDLAKVIRQAVDLSEPELRAAGVSNLIDCTEGVIVAGVDVLLVRLLRNLLANAIRVSPEGGAVRISAAVSDMGTDRPAQATIIVADEGPGIKEEIRRRTLASGPVDLSPRKGLGLAICREIAEFHGGDLAIENGAEGGAVVRVCLPLWRG